MSQLDSATLGNLFDFYADATLAVKEEIGDVPEFDQDRLVQAFQRLLYKLPLPEWKRFVEFLDAPKKSVKDECWFQQRLWELLPELRADDARIIVWQIATNKFQE